MGRTASALALVNETDEEAFGNVLVHRAPEEQSPLAQRITNFGTGLAESGERSD